MRSIEFRGYVWKRADVLGEGSFAYVYRGKEKLTGKPVAVKVFKEGFGPSKGDDCLTKVDHKYVVKQLFCDYHEVLGSWVLVMEFCSEGSLHSMLRSPRFYKGLNDKTFLLLLRCLKEAQKALYAANVVHRDIKPLNICYHMDENGNKYFKLVDFGYAKNLSEGENGSIVGTVRMADPLTLFRLLTQNQTPGEAGESEYHDMWATGATLYLAATTKQPFKLHCENRELNTETIEQWYRTTATKPPNVIARQQLSEWPMECKDFYRLPANIQLSPSLSKLLVGMLSRLLETRPDSAWKLEDYFAGCENILSRQCVRMFAPHDSRIQKCYLQRVSSRTLQQEYNYLWRHPKVEEECHPFPEENMNQSPDVMIFHHGFKLSLNDSQIMLPNEKQEVFIMVPTDPALYGHDIHKTLQHRDSIIHEGPKRSVSDATEYFSYTHGPTYPIRLEEYQRQIHIFCKALWKYAREIKSLQLASQLYPLTVTSLCNDLATRCQIALALLPFHKAFKFCTDGIIEETVENCLTKNIGSTLWVEKMTCMPNMQRKKVDASDIAKKAEGIWKKVDSLDKAESFKLQVSRMLTTVEELHTILYEYLHKMYEAFHSWMREFYFPNAANLEAFEQRHAELETKCALQQSIIQQEMMVSMQKAEKFKTALKTVINAMNAR